MSHSLLRTALLSIDRAASSAVAPPPLRRALGSGSLLLSAALLLIAGCGEGQVLLDPDAYAARPGGSDGGPGGGEDGEHPPGPLHPDTVSVEEHDCFDFADVLTDDRRFIDLHFTCEASTAGLVPGQIVWGLDDGGYLVRLVQVENDGTVAHLVTEFASLAEAVTDVEFDEVIDLDDAARANRIDFGGRVLDEVEGEGGTSTVTVTRGELDVNTQVAARGSFGFLRLKSVTSRNRLTLDLAMDVHYRTDGPVARSQTVVLDTLEQPFTLKVGPVRVSGVLRSTVSLGFEHTSTGPMDVTTSFVGGGTIDMGGTYTMPGSWSPYWNPNVSGTVLELQPEGLDDWDGRAFLHIEGTVFLNGNSGGTSHYELGTDGHAQAGCESTPWQTGGRMDAQTAMRLRFMGRSVDHDFPVVDQVLDSKEGTVFHAQPPPGCMGAGSGLCASAGNLTCGAVVAGDTSTDPLASSEMGSYPCAVGNYDAPELVYRWVANTASTVEIRLLDADPTELNHDILVLGGGSGGVCAAESCVAFGFNSVQFDPIPGETYFVAIDGFDDHAGPFQAQLDCSP
jgi:hypothetical protein